MYILLIFKFQINTKRVGQYPRDLGFLWAAISLPPRSWIHRLWVVQLCPLVVLVVVISLRVHLLVDYNAVYLLASLQKVLFMEIYLFHLGDLDHLSLYLWFPCYFTSYILSEQTSGLLLPISPLYLLSANCCTSWTLEHISKFSPLIIQYFQENLDIVPYLLFHCLR